MATIARLIVEISAKSIKLKKGLSSATSKIKAFTKKAAKILAGIGSAIGVGAVGVVIAITKTVNKYATEIDKLAKTSSKLGTTVTALQKLQYQAELTGVSADTMTMAMQRMVRRVSEAAKGTGAAKDALKELGLSAESLNRLSPDKQFYAISDAMKQISNQGDKVRLAMKIFDTEGVSLVNTMNGNLKQMGDEFDSLGISITQSGARMVEAYQDSKTKLSAIFSGFGIKLTEQLAGPFTKLIEWITKTVKEMGGMEVAAKNFAKFVINGIKASIIAVQSLIKSFVKLENLMLRIEKLKLVPAVIGEAVAQKVTGSDVVGAAAERTLEIDKQIAENNASMQASKIVDSLDNLLESLTKSVGEKIDMTDVIKPEHYKALNKVASDANVMADKTKKAAESADKFTTAINSATQAISPTKTTISKSSHYSKIGGLNPGLSGLSMGGKAAVTATESAQNAINKNNISLGKININMQTDAGEIAGDIFAEPAFLTGLKRFADKNTNSEARAVTI